MRKTTSSLGHVPGLNWEFDEAVTAAFDDMLERSIPDYGCMRQLVTRMARRFIQRGSRVIDLGASRGDMICRIGPYSGAKFVAIENSPPMLEVLRARFANAPHVTVVDLDLAKTAHLRPREHASVVLAVLTLQFLKPMARRRVMQQAFEALKPGGAFVVVEKVEGSSWLTQGVLRAEYEEMKHRHGYSRDEIDRKRLSLRGVLLPQTHEANERQLDDAGFRHVECFWRTLNFAAWIAVKQ